MLTPGKLYPGSPVRLTVNFQTDEGTDTDPSSVLIKVMSPSGVQTTYTYGTDDEIQKVDAGDYTADITPDAAGRWRFRWETTGNGTTVAMEGDFLVQYSAFYEDVSSGYDL